MLSFEEARERLRRLPTRPRVRTVSLSEAAGRVCAEDVLMDRDQPGFDRATMDGYAVRLDGQRSRFEVIGEIRAGQTFDGALKAGQAVRIMTGAPCPADVTVVPVELSDDGDAEVEITDPSALVPGRNIAWRGEDARAGDTILRPGTRMGPAAIAAAAMTGAEELRIFEDPSVEIVTTGDEIGGRGSAQIRNTNGPMLSALLEGLGCTVRRAHARDDEGELESTLRTAAERSDVVVTTGGVSMGRADLVPATLARLGFETVFHKVAVQPGKPILVARRGDTFFLGLPGNPVSVLATAHLFLIPVLRGFWGTPGDAWLQLPLAVDHEHRGRRHLFLPATLQDGGVRPVPWNGSGDLFAAASADGLISLPAGTVLRQGETVAFLPYASHAIGHRAQLPPRGAARDRS